MNVDNSRSYKAVEDVPTPPLGSGLSRQRSMSFSAVSVSSTSVNPIADPPLPMTHQEITAPGGFRRSFIVRKHRLQNADVPYLPRFITTNYNEMRDLYGHFAGEDLSEDDEDEEDEENESTQLLPTFGPRSLARSQRRHKDHRHSQSPQGERHTSNKTSTFKTILLLLKSFIGTGILFLPKAFSNGGHIFSSVSLLVCSLLSFYCFILLMSTKDKVAGVRGYGDLGYHLFGTTMKLAILSSIALSQIGFGAAYTVFTATNLQTLCHMISSDTLVTRGTINFFIVLQTILFIPLSFTRNLAKLTATVLLADFCIFVGLLYLYYYPIRYLAQDGIAWNKTVAFNSNDWSLFLGTAIFTFEGIGLLIPIQESMKSPQHFRISLSLVMFIVTAIFISFGLICYLAFGYEVDTVVFSSFPQDSPYTLIVQLLYSVAILLSTPLQLFPAIRILENWVFKSNVSGKYNKKIKWAKNYFRTVIVIMTTMIAWGGAADLDKFVSLVGSFACIPLIYVYPPLLHLKASMSDAGNRSTAFILLVDIMLVGLGVVMMFYTSWKTISLWVS